MNRAKSLLCLTGLVAISTVVVQAQNVITDWNTIASTTIVKQGGKPSGAGAVWFAYASIASYDAINAIAGQFQPYYYAEKAPEGASLEAAAVSAAHRVLVHYFPTQEDQLNAQFAASIATLDSSAERKLAGIEVGEAAAAALIEARANDGLEAAVTYTPAAGPGQWQPTPPGFLAAATPWLGVMRPFTMSSATQFLPQGPTPLASQHWKADYNLTRTLGAANSQRRTRAQTEIGLFWTEHTPQQYARALGYLAVHYQLSVSETARLFAMLWTGAADASIACFHAKYTYNFWRPVTAIPAGGGNGDLLMDPGWLPLGTTPNHPEYPAQHGCISNAIAHVIEAYFGTPRVHIVVDSTVFPDGVHTHTFEDTRDLFREVFWARIYAGFHFRHSLVAGGDLGRDVARELVANHFRPVSEAH
jgi:hypothetical protein